MVHQKALELDSINVVSLSQSLDAGTPDLQRSSNKNYMSKQQEYGKPSALRNVHVNSIRTALDKKTVQTQNNSDIEALLGTSKKKAKKVIASRTKP